MDTNVREIVFFSFSLFCWGYCCVIVSSKCCFRKCVLQVPDTGTRVLDNTRPFWYSSIVCFWMPPARSKESIKFSGNTGTPEMFQYLPILGHSSIWNLKICFPLFLLNAYLVLFHNSFLVFFFFLFFPPNSFEVTSKLRISKVIRYLIWSFVVVDKCRTGLKSYMLTNK